MVSSIAGALQHGLPGHGQSEKSWVQYAALKQSASKPLVMLVQCCKRAQILFSHGCTNCFHSRLSICQGVVGSLSMLTPAFLPVCAGGAAQVEHLFQSFVRAQPQQDPQDTAGGAYLHYDSSADEAGPAGTGAGAAEGKGVGGGGSKAQRGRGGRGGGGRGRGASKTGAGRPRAAGGVRKRGGGGSKAPAARQQQMAAAAAAAQVVGGASKAAAGGRGAAQGSDSDDDYQPSS
jgi:hypothetical protein